MALAWSSPRRDQKSEMQSAGIRDLAPRREWTPDCSNGSGCWVGHSSACCSCARGAATAVTATRPVRTIRRMRARRSIRTVQMTAERGAATRGAVPIRVVSVRSRWARPRAATRPVHRARSVSRATAEARRPPGVSRPRRSALTIEPATASRTICAPRSAPAASISHRTRSCATPGSTDRTIERWQFPEAEAVNWPRSGQGAVARTLLLVPDA
jgi:hypothetical protein